MKPEDKFCPPHALSSRLERLSRPLVMTNGVFDVLHRGHVSYLDRAAKLGSSLLVAVNSDASARMLGKGPDRPLNNAENRTYVIAGLESVSVVTTFDELTPVELIKAVRPDFYVKGGDYDMETLEETNLVRSWGGQSLAIPFVDGFSTTSLIKRIRQPQISLSKAAFLDRDGVINRDNAYVHRWEDFEFVSGAIEGMKILQDSGYALVIVTNQSGLARGYYTEDEYLQLAEAMRQHLASHGVYLRGIYHCPHHPKGTVPTFSIDCDCRKPAPGMLLQAASELGLSLPDSILIGDKPSDIQAARAAGVRHAYLVESENPESGGKVMTADGYFANLLECATVLTKNLED